jgi:hypothetical protein
LRSLHGLFFLPLLLSLSFPFSAAAQSRDQGDEVIELYERAIDVRLRKEKQEKEKEKKRTVMEKALLRTHQRFSRSIFNLSDSIDEFFAGERFQEEKNGSIVRMGYELLMVDSRDPEHNPRVNTRLVLPRTQNRLNFLLQSLDDENQNEDPLNPTSRTDANPRNQEEKKQNFFAGLRLKNTETKTWSVNTDAGIKLIWPPDPFARFRVRRSFFMSAWELRLTENVNWFESQGWWQTANIDLERPLPPKNLLKFGNTGTRRDSIGYWEFNQAVTWFHQSSKKDAFGYAVGLTSAEEPAYAVTSYYISTSYRRNILEDWMFFDINPVGSWPREEHFTFVPSVKIKFEMVFGGL